MRDAWAVRLAALLNIHNLFSVFPRCGFSDQIRPSGVRRPPKQLGGDDPVVNRSGAGEGNRGGRGQDEHLGGRVDDLSIHVSGVRPQDEQPGRTTRTNNVLSGPEVSSIFV